MKKVCRALLFAVVAAAFSSAAFAQQRQNVILFVFDGLRAAAVTPETAPTLARLRAQGVDFRSTHALFPTVTTANGSAIATGHYLGDTGDFGNSLYSGFPVASAGGNMTPFIQDNAVLAELNKRNDGNFLRERTLVAAAREHGYATAVLGKVGPVGIQDITKLDGSATLFFDDQTGKRSGITLPADVLDAMKSANIPLAAPGRTTGAAAGKTTNIAQQTFYRDIVTKVLLPRFKAAGMPFVMVYWSPDPDGTQHTQTDSIGSLTPGINGETSLRSIKEADEAMGAILAKLKELGLDSSTNIFVTADHGFGTISKESKTSPSTRFSYQGVPAGQLPPGFLAIDLAETLGLPLYEPTGKGAAIDYKVGQHPRRANAVLGREPEKPDVVVAANGGADLIYLPQSNAKELAPKVVQALMAQDYSSGIFVDDALGKIPGTLPLSTIGLKGGARTPTPSIVVNFRTYSTGCDRPLYCAVVVADTTLRQGQGHHGSLGRADTANFMAASGPAFKQRFINRAPVSNADVAHTLARVLKVDLPPAGKLKGRVLTETFKGSKPVRVTRRTIVSARGDHGLRTIVNLQYVGATPYFDTAGFPDRALGLRVPGPARRVAIARD